MNKFCSNKKSNKIYTFILIAIRHVLVIIYYDVNIKSKLNLIFHQLNLIIYR